ncbi:MAG: alpha-L-fucosidase [Bacteroidales bacterium]|nr:alpha-L-fucosidase [Bacteroidales bacterium]
MKKIFLLFLFSMISGLLFPQQTMVDTTWESLRNRPYPQWFKDAKLGVFIHWGIYSVPSYGSAESYGEWFLRGLIAGDKTRTDFMKTHFGENFSYEDFAPLFKAELFDAGEWASIFGKAGAKYIILVAKHHDGYCLWPSKFAPGWNSMDAGPKRDIVGEVSEAVRKHDIRFGLYYSLPEWNNPLHHWYTDHNDSIHTYIREHMIPQFKEVVGTYKPEVLFTDGEWFHTAEDWHARELIAWYYNLVGEDAIVNDRWGHGADIGFLTPEYSSGSLKTERPWAEVRGLGRSFGLNRNEKLDAYMTSTELIHFFARTVGNGGGITINVGPAADGKIPLLQQERLEQLGKWLNVNEEAIYGSEQWIRNGEEKEVLLKRIDPQIDFNWVRNTPGFPISEDHFSAVWEGYIQPEFSEEYIFSALADDGMKLIIDGKLIIDQWENHAEESESEAMRKSRNEGLSGKIKLKKEQLYPIRIEYYESLQNASISLFWQSKSQEKEVVSQKNLLTGQNVSSEKGLMAEYRSMRQHIAYTINHGNLYAISFEWPDTFLELPIPAPEKNTKISLLGRDGYLPWHFENGLLKIDVTNVKFNEMPCESAWTFKIENYK